MIKPSQGRPCSRSVRGLLAIVAIAVSLSTVGCAPSKPALPNGIACNWNISQGSGGFYVGWWQLLINYWEYSDHIAATPLVVDSSFGPATQAATTSFESWNNAHPKLANNGQPLTVYVDGKVIWIDWDAMSKQLGGSGCNHG